MTTTDAHPTDVPDAANAATGARFVGQSIVRREDPRLLAGRGRYIADVVLPNELHAAFLRSEVARGRITALNVEAARELPGVIAVFTAAELNPMVKATWWTLSGPDAIYPPKICLAGDEVRMVGDPIAIVVAESRAIAEDGVDLIDIDIDVLPPLLDPDENRFDSENLVHPEVGTNCPGSIPAVDDPALDEAFANAARVVKARFVQHRYCAVPMECRGIVADWDPFNEQLLIWTATQSSHEVRGFFARLLDVPENKVRVMLPDVGGGFGLKVMSMRDEWAVVLASVQLGRPVKWIEDRRENLIAGAHARDERMLLEFAFDDDARLLAIRGDHVENVGAYPYAASASSAGLVGMCLPGPYKVPLVGYSNSAVYTNTLGRAPYRGPFLMETVGPEQMIDVCARELGIDPLELRRRNVIPTDEFPYTLPSQMVYDNITPADTLEQAAEIIDYDGFRRQQAEARAQGRYLGIGISLCVEPSAIAFGNLGTEAAVLRMEISGKVNLILGSSDTGMSTATTMAQVVADQLGCDVEDVTVTQGDTNVTPYGAGTQGSRSAVLYGNAAMNVAGQLREKVLAIAAHRLEAAVGDLRIDSGVVSVAGVPGASVTFAEVGHMALVGHDLLPPDLEKGLEVNHRFRPAPFTWCNACHICTVEIDPATGHVEILRYVVSEDCGVAINPKIVAGQVYGGVVQGIGGVLYEHAQYDAAGNPLASTFLDYLLPTAAEVPMIELGHIYSRADNPLGAKGVGEGGAVASPPAVFNAVADALAPLGVQLRATPLGPNEIMTAIEQATTS
jgi:carbon-monoxide dehydrogenase large subunit